MASPDQTRVLLQIAAPGGRVLQEDLEATDQPIRESLEAAKLLRRDANRIQLANGSMVYFAPVYWELTREGRVVARADGSQRMDKASAGSVFLVHGHNQHWRDAVSKFVQDVTGKAPVILDEQPGMSRTIIEKLEDHSEDVAFAIVIFTGDDEGRSRTHMPRSAAANSKKSIPERPRLRRRARQNVVLELGFFLGRLQRSKVCVLFEHGVEMPSDYSGVEYVELTDTGPWREKLRRELVQAGIGNIPH